jgi:hypothetical protein
MLTLITSFALRRSMMSPASTVQLLDLPEHLLARVANFADLASRYAAASTCTTMQCALRLPSAWDTLILRDDGPLVLFERAREMLLEAATRSGGAASAMCLQGVAFSNEDAVVALVTAVTLRASQLHLLDARSVRCGVDGYITAGLSPESVYTFLEIAPQADIWCDLKVSSAPLPDVDVLLSSENVHICSVQVDGHSWAYVDEEGVGDVDLDDARALLDAFVNAPMLNLVAYEVTNVPLLEEHVARLSHVRGLRSLSLYRCMLQEDALPHLTRCVEGGLQALFVGDDEEGDEWFCMLNNSDDVLRFGLTVSLSRTLTSLGIDDQSMPSLSFRMLIGAVVGHPTITSLSVQRALIDGIEGHETSSPENMANALQMLLQTRSALRHFSLFQTPIGRPPLEGWLLGISRNVGLERFALSKLDPLSPEDLAHVWQCPTVTAGQYMNGSGKYIMFE